MPKENPDLTLFHSTWPSYRGGGGGGGGVGKQNSNCVPGSKSDSDCAVWCKVQRCIYVPTISAIRCETVEKWAKYCVFGAIIENKRVRARK